MKKNKTVEELIRDNPDYHTIRGKAISYKDREREESTERRLYEVIVEIMREQIE